MEISQCNDKDSVWDTYAYHPKLSVSIFKDKVIQGHEVKGKVKLKKIEFGQRDTCFWVIFCREHKT